MLGLRLKAAALTAALLLIVSAITYIAPVNAQSAPCPDAPPTRLRVGGKGQMSTDSSTDASIPVRLRENPGTDSRIVGGLRRGVIFTVLAGPQCKDGYTWYQVVFTGSVGWLAEGSPSAYFVEPLNEAGDEITPSTPTPIDIPTPTLPALNIPTVTGSTGFAPFQPGNVDLSGAVTPYQVAGDFGNVSLSEPLTTSQRDLLLRNTFVVSSGESPEFYVLYQNALANNQPLLITVDSLLHSYHLALNKVLRTVEKQRLIPMLNDLNRGLLIETDKLYQSLQGTDWQEAARHTVAYVSVAAQLLDSSITIPDYASDLVTTELANIDSAAAGTSIIFPESAGEDWSEYIPSGHYLLDEALSRYYRAMTYYGRMIFRLENVTETQLALLLLTALRNANVAGRLGVDVWRDLYDSTLFFTGQPDNLTVHHYFQIMDALYGANADINNIRLKGAEPFIAATKALPLPKTIGATAGDVQGLHFMSRRFVWDMYVLDQLVSNNVGTTSAPRNVPSALDIFAAFGSERALQILDKEGATAIFNYNSQMNTLRQQSSPLGELDWTITADGSWFWTSNALTQPIPAGYPAFMLNQPYADRLLQAVAGSYTELKHDTVLYAEPAYTPPDTTPSSRKSAPPSFVRPPNYVEPVPLFWARLAAFAEMTDVGLGKRSLLNASDSELLKGIADLARRLQAYSIKELHNEPLTPDEQIYLDNYGVILEGIVTASADKVSDQPGAYGLTGQPDSAQIITLAVDFNRSHVLHVGTGRVFDMYAIVPVNGKLYLARGGVFSHYEFQERLNNRLTDDEWRELVAEGKTPARPTWTGNFISSDAVDPDVARAIRQFQSDLSLILWLNPVYSYSQFRDKTTALERYVASQLEPLSRARQYEGRQLIDVSFRDLQSDGKTATVVVREIWLGSLHNSGADDESDGPRIGERGPYTLDVTYTLENLDGVWTVTNIKLNGQVPAWRNVTS